MTARERLLLAELLQGYRTHRGSLRHKPKTVRGDENTIKDFLEHAHGLPGQVQPHHFERWSDSLFTERGVAAATQRKYQGALRTFFGYLIDEPRFKLRVRQELHCEIVQVATPDNSMVHCRERELERNQPRRSFTKQETERLLHQFDIEIRLAFQQRSKALRTLQRDKAMFSVVLERGLRADEGLGLDTDSFEPFPGHPELGDFGMARVYGKGGVWRQVPALHPVVSKLLRWYIDEVRPTFLLKSQPGDKALFLSERGTRLRYSTFHRAFCKIRDAAGLPRELVPHCLRHTSVSKDGMEGLTAEGNRIRHGHVYQSTTQGYTHFPDDFVRDDFSRAVRRNMEPSGK